ncbi:hypothetical protein B0A52_00375 [Exophiala mesophila]|uniref:Tyrosinase copper-binding domain-containing protein n=1 Tax=Exophiala mesophila TaxID=212818 RepID=A0A438NJW7_EXOME|nr:hypothetical protein B0A52_00375 [Exophiala mesophila]
MEWIKMAYDGDLPSIRTIDTQGLTLRHVLSPTEKAAYIQADLCLMQKPPKAFLDVEGVQNIWDELQYLHILLANVIHDVGGALPWHRLFIHTHEYLQKTECGYQGTQPYWDEQLDQGIDLNHSPIFDPVTGFGQNGQGDNHCVLDGPFANLTLHVSGDGPQDYCLSREFDPDSFTLGNITYVEECMSMQNYSSAFPCWFLNPHIAGHWGVGGTMLDVIASPGDPVFYLHHANLDRLWWDWQVEDLPDRLWDMGGSNVPSDEALEINGFPPVSQEMIDGFGDPGNVTTLRHILNMGGIVPNRTILEVMDIRNQFLCYEYV